MRACRRVFIPFGLSTGLIVVALGVLQGAIPLIAIGLAVLASLVAWTAYTVNEFQ